MTAIEYAISKHAIIQYLKRTRMLKVYPPEDPEKSLRKMLAKAHIVEVSAVEKTKRLITHGFKEVLYLQHDQWRFVVDPQSNTLLTAERIHRHQN